MLKDHDEVQILLLALLLSIMLETCMLLFGVLFKGNSMLMVIFSN